LTTPPKPKKAKTARSVIIIEVTITFIERSFSVLTSSSCACPPFLNSLAARPTADLITPKDLMIPIMPAVAIPQMPI
jgi:hypothetical protein